MRKNPRYCGRGAPKPLRYLLAIALAAGFLVGPIVHGAEAADPGPADPILGLWSGTVDSPQGTKAAVGLDFYRTKSGVLLFRMNFPEMFTYNEAFGIPVECPSPGHYLITPDFAMDLHLQGGRLAGTFGPGLLPITLSRGGAFGGKPEKPDLPAPPAFLWQCNLGSGTWAPPAVQRGTVYIGTSAGVLHAVRASDGKILWKLKLGAGIDGRAVVGASTVYVLDANEDLVAVDRDRGVPRWTTRLYDEALAGKKLPDNPTFNHRSATPLLDKGVLYCGSGDGGLYAIDAASGAKLWRHDAKAPVFSGVGLLGKDSLLFGTMDGSVVVLDRSTHAETLRVRTGGAVVTTPLVASGTLIVGSRDYMLYGFNIADGSPRWRFSYWFSWVESTPALVDGLLYVGASDFSRVTCLDPATGRARWSTPVHGMNWGTPLVTVDRVFTGTASQNIKGTAIAHVGGLMALDRESGAPLWQFRAALPPEGEFGGYAGNLALAGNKIIAAGFDGKLVALPAN